MAQFVDGNCRGFKVDAAIGQYLRVKLSGNSQEVSAAGATDDDIGTTGTETFTAGDHVDVRLRSASGTRKMVAAGAVAIGADLYAAASGKVNDVRLLGARYVGKALQAASGDGSIIEVLELPHRQASDVVSEEVTFTEDGDTTYTGAVSVPAGATILDIVVHQVALWDDGTSASLKVGDDNDDDGFFTAVDLKATDLLAEQSINFDKTGGQEGAYLAGTATHWTDRYSASARSVTGVVTTGGQDGTAGRTRMTVIYSLPSSITAATGA